jgi:hypothetical protein
MLKEMIRQIDEPEHAVLSLEVQAAMGPVVQPERSQFEMLVRHLIDRLFNNDMVSLEGEAAKRLILAAIVIAVPQLIFALFLYPVYHGIPPIRPLKPPFWSQVNHHYFYVMYSFVVMGVVTVFEWEQLFPELLDVFVLSTLPIPRGRLFWARITALGLFLAMFLVVMNVLGAVFFPLVVDIPSLVRHAVAHVVAVISAGVFIAAFFLALQGVLIIVLGQRLSRMMSPFLQGLSMMMLLTVLVLTPMVMMFLQPLLGSDNMVARYFPPSWFLGIYEWLLAGSSTLPMFTALARMGVFATLLVMLVVVVTYPLAYRLRTRQLIEGSTAQGGRSWLSRPIGALIHAVVVRVPRRRAVYHFINQTLLRTQRHRVYLAMYGGVGITLMIASSIVIRLGHGHVRFGVTEYGLRAAIPMLAFWTVAGLRMALVSPVDQRGAWVFGIIHGRPRLDHLVATKVWVFLWASALSLAAVAGTHAIGPVALRGRGVTVVQIVVAVGLSLLLTDAFFGKVMVVPFTKGQSAGRTNLAIVVIPYLVYFPLLVMYVVNLEGWMEKSGRHLIYAVCFVALAHLGFRWRHRQRVEEQAQKVELEDVEVVYQGLGLRSE